MFVVYSAAAYSAVGPAVDFVHNNLNAWYGCCVMYTKGFSFPLLGSILLSPSLVSSRAERVYRSECAALVCTT